MLTNALKIFIKKARSKKFVLQTTIF